MGRKRKKDQSDKYCLGKMKKIKGFTATTMHSFTPSSSLWHSIRFFFLLLFRVAFKLIINVIGKMKAYFAPKC